MNIEYMNNLTKKGFILISSVCRSNKCISTELVCDGEKDCPESDDEAECIGLITPAGKKYD